MTSSPAPLARAADALEAARSAWAAAAVPGAGLDGVSGASLVALNDAVAGLQKQVNAVASQVAAHIARASRPELGNDGLARTQGFRTPAALIAATTGISTGAAVRLVAVGEATADRVSLTGESLPPKHPAVADGVQDGRIGVDAAASIIRLLDKVSARVTGDDLAEAEELLVEKATGLPLEQVNKILQRAEAWLDPDGVAPREDELRTAAAVRVWEDASGAIRIDGTLDPERGAPLKTAIDAYVGRILHRRETDAGATAIDREVLSIPQLQADALAAFCRHVLECDGIDVPTAGATVVVRVSLEDLQNGTGHATIDGLTQPISISTARRMAAANSVLPLVLGGKSEILDLGRSQRFFSRAQGLALTERDGGCAGCGLPPGMTQIHHLRWWERDSGPTDLSNGILLCVRCHHRVHDDGWTIDIEGDGIDAKVWFTPPPHVDASQAPRLGGRARFDYQVA